MTIRYPDGSVYDGDVKSGKKDGLGIFTDSDGSRTIGEFKYGVLPCAVLFSIILTFDLKSLR